MRKVGVVGALLLVSMFSACRLINFVFEQVKLPPPTPSPLTIAYGTEVYSIISNYERTSRSLEARLDRSILSNVMTGDLLKRRMAAQHLDTFHIMVDLDLREVHVLEYTPMQIKAIGCGSIDMNEVTLEGEYIRSLPNRIFQKFYVFVNEEGTWKLVTAASFEDHHTIERDWNYVDDRTKDLIGDLPSYAREYLTCG